MTPLNQQLEDKKKEREELRKALGEKDFMDSHEEHKEICKFKLTKVKAEIAILEQAIAEMQKQRQEILEEMGYKIFSEDEQKSNNVWYKKGWDDNASRINKELKQLNQPKEEQ